MKNYHLIVCGLLFSLLVCCTHASKKTPVILSDYLRDAYSHMDAEMSQSREPVQFQSGKKATNCHEYLSLKKTDDLQEGVNNTLISQDYVICDTLQQLKNSSSVKANSLIAQSKGELLAKYLAVDSYPSSLYQKTDDEHNTLTSLLGDSLSIYPDRVVSDTKDWYYELQVVAIADINSNGEQDWLIWLTDRAKLGNYNTMALLIAFDVKARQPIRVN